MLDKVALEATVEVGKAETGAAIGAPRRAAAGAHAG